VALIVTRVHVIFKFSGYLEKLTSLLTRSIKGSSFKGGKQDFLKVITKPLTELVVQVNTCLTVEVLAWCKELIFIYINFKVGNVRVLLLFFIMWLFNGGGGSINEIQIISFLYNCYPSSKCKFEFTGTKKISLIYFYLNKNWKIYWSWARGPVLILRTKSYAIWSGFNHDKKYGYS
jgi:hypothetical protein